MAATDAAAVFAVLRGSTLPRRLARTLEGESGINDPIAILLVIGCIEAIQDPSYGVADALLLAVEELGIGLVVGPRGRLRSRVLALQRVRLPSAGLYPVASIADGRARLRRRRHPARLGLPRRLPRRARARHRLDARAAHDRRPSTTASPGSPSSALFLILGLLVFPEDLGDIALEGTAIARRHRRARAPAGDARGHRRRRVLLGERLVLGWAGPARRGPGRVRHLRGDGGHRGRADDLQRHVLRRAALDRAAGARRSSRWRGCSACTSDEAAIPAPLVEPVLLNRLGAEVIQFPVRDGDAVVGHAVRELGLPREALLNVVVRGERAIPPRGSTVVEAGDQLHVIVRQEAAVEFRELLRRWRTGPLGLRERPRPQPRSRPSVTTVRPWEAGDGDPSRPRRRRRARGDRPAAHAPRRARRARAARRRPLRDHRPAAAIGPAGELQQVARRRLSRAETSRRARLVARGRRRARALGRGSTRDGLGAGEPSSRGPTWNVPPIASARSRLEARPMWPSPSASPSRSAGKPRRRR